jgi:hypothetical protein
MFSSVILLILNLVNGYILPTQQNSPKVLFFTGGNSLMPVDIYSDFIFKLKNNYDVSIIRNNLPNNKNSLELIEQLFEYSGEKEVIPIGHSSGCTTLLNYCSKLKNVNKCILLDPVDNNLKKDINIKFNKILQINAEKSYKWKMNEGFEFIQNPIPKVPFIPAFSMNTKKKFINSNITKIEIKEYGHCDILDTAFSNIMHNTLAEGNNDRNNLNEYRLLLNDLITLFINDNELTDELLDYHYNKFNIKYEIN